MECPCSLLHGFASPGRENAQAVAHGGETLGPMGPSIVRKEASAGKASLPAPLLVCKSVQSRCQEECGRKGGKTAVPTRNRDGAGQVSRS